MKRGFVFVFFLFGLLLTGTAHADDVWAEIFKRCARDPRTGKIACWDRRYEVCPFDYGTRAPLRNVERTGRDVRAIAAQAAEPVQGGRGRLLPARGSSELEAVALEQVRCPVRRLTPHKAGVPTGVCGDNGYRASSYDCGYYVRRALEKAVFKRSVGGLGHAKHSGCALQRLGMKNLCNNGCAAKSKTCGIKPTDAPNGSVLVYDTTGCAHWAGHIEIKTSRGYVSDYVSSRPRTGGDTVGRCRRLIGIYVK